MSSNFVRRLVGPSTNLGVRQRENVLNESAHSQTNIETVHGQEVATENSQINAEDFVVGQVDGSASTSDPWIETNSHKMSTHLV